MKSPVGDGFDGDRKEIAMSLLLALGLVVHGFAHIGYVCTQVSFATTGPRFVTGVLDAGTVDAAGNALVALTAIAFLLAAFAAAGVVVPAEWWRPLVVVGSLASAALLAFSPMAYSAPGLLVDAALLWAATGLSWTPAPFFGR